MRGAQFMLPVLHNAHARASKAKKLTAAQQHQAVTSASQISRKLLCFVMQERSSQRNSCLLLPHN